MTRDDALDLQLQAESDLARREDASAQYLSVAMTQAVFETASFLIHEHSLAFNARFSVAHDCFRQFDPGSAVASRAHFLSGLRTPADRLITNITAHVPIGLRYRFKEWLLLEVLPRLEDWRAACSSRCAPRDIQAETNEHWSHVRWLCRGLNPRILARDAPDAERWG